MERSCRRSDRDIRVQRVEECTILWSTNGRKWSSRALINTLWSSEQHSKRDTYDAYEGRVIMVEWRGWVQTTTLSYGTLRNNFLIDLWLSLCYVSAISMHMLMVHERIPT
jgi:hypothetical protein